MTAAPADSRPASAQWQQSGPILLLQTKRSEADIDDTRKALPKQEVIVLETPLAPEPKKRWQIRAKMLRDALTGQTDPYVRPEKALNQTLTDCPEINAVLALDADAQRIAHRALTDRTSVVGFGHLDPLVRAVKRSLILSLDDSANRLVDFRHVYEAEGDVDRGRPDRTAVSPHLVVGPGNLDGMATSIANAVAGGELASAASFAIGEVGSPADVMLSSADWGVDSIRRGVRTELRSASHALITDPDLIDLFDAAHTKVSVLNRHGATANPKAGFTTDPALVGPGCSWLPVPLPAGVFAVEPGPLSQRPRVLVIADGNLPPTAKSDLASVHASGAAQILNLADLPDPIRLQTGATCDFVLDLRDEPACEPPVVAALANGARLISDLTRWPSQIPQPPHVERGIDPARTLTQVLSSADRGADPAAADVADPGSAGVEYARKYHDGQHTLAVLADFLATHEAPR